MPLRLLVGVLFILAGGYTLARGFHYTTHKDVVDVGGVRVSTDNQTEVPRWVGGGLALAGLVLIMRSGSRRS
jgi:hypothetical protein